MSLVPQVTELLLAELLYLQYDSPTRPIYMYINSTGVAVRACACVCGGGGHAARGAGARWGLPACLAGPPSHPLPQLPPTHPLPPHPPSRRAQKGAGKLGYEAEAFAIYDTMRYVKPPIATVCVGTAFGEAAMLLAAGDPGRRAALPSTSIMGRLRAEGIV